MLIITGTFSLHRSGFGFVTPTEASLREDVFIPASKTMQAMDGDTVKVRVSPKRKKNKGPEGEVIKITKRYKQSYVCICVEKLSSKTWKAFFPALTAAKTIAIKTEKDAPPINVGDRLQLRVKKWGKPEATVKVHLVSHLGHLSEAKQDNVFAALEFGLETTFEEEVAQEAKKLPEEVTSEDKQGRDDFTRDEVITIDPDTAKDFDDALSIRIDEKGFFHLNVHIADVSHYVAPGSKIDSEARRRGNSTYLISQVLPMIPKSLSNGLCSLKEGVERLTASVLLVFDPKGNRVSHTVTRGVIKSQKRFTYKEALAVLNGQLPSKHEKTLHNFVTLARLLKQKKKERGCLELALDELVIKVDDQGEPVDYETIEYDITHQLVEEFMLQANEVIAMSLDKADQRGIYRIHEEPEEENIKEFFRFARALGLNVPPEPTIKDLEKAFSLAKGSPVESILAFAYIRCLKLAKYSEQNLGHFSLFLDHYTHFTSPIRRYSDLVVHRQLFGITHYGEDELVEIAAHLSKTERVSFKAEQHVILWKKLRFLAKWLDEDPSKVYSAVITKVKPKGVLVSIAPLNFDFFVEVRKVRHDFFHFDLERSLLIGERSGWTLHVGMKCKLKLKEVDLLTLSSHWSLQRPQKQKKSN